MKKTIIFMICMSMIMTGTAIAGIELYDENDIKIVLDAEIEAVYNLRNFTKKNDSLFDSKSHNYWDNKINFGFTAKSDNWKSKFSLEFTDMRDDDNSVVADGDDGELEIQDAFINYRFTDTPFFMQAGRWEQSFGTEMFYGDTWNTGAMLGIKAGDILTFTAGNFTTTETKDDREDHDMSFISADAKLGNKNKLSLFLVMVREDTKFDPGDPEEHDMKLYNLGLNYKASFGGIGVRLEGNKQFGGYTDDDGITDIDYNGYAMMAKLNMKLDNLKPAITVGYGSADDDPDDEKISNYIGYEADYEPDNIVIDERFAGTNDTITNLRFIRFDVSIKTGDNLTITPGIGYYEHVEEVDVEDENGVVVGKSDKIGVEADLKIKYEFNEYVSFKFTQGFLFADDGIGIDDPDNAWKSEVEMAIAF